MVAGGDEQGAGLVGADSFLVGGGDSCEEVGRRSVELGDLGDQAVIAAGRAV